MKMSDILEPENIIPDLKARDKKRAIEELADAVVKTNPSLDKDSLVRVLWIERPWVALLSGTA